MLPLVDRPGFDGERSWLEYPKTMIECEKTVIESQKPYEMPILDLHTQLLYNNSSPTTNVVLNLDLRLEPQIKIT